MKSPVVPETESERQSTLDSLGIVYTPTEERFERITRIAKRLFDVPITLISLVTNDKQWFKSCQGLNLLETDREISFCAHAINHDEAFVITNAAADPDFRDNPLVTGEPRIRFYAGQPLIINGQRIGTLCIIDRHPRQMKPKDYDSLRCLASWVQSEISTSRKLKNLQLNEFLELDERQTLIDPVTGDLNRPAFDLMAERLNNLKDSSTAISVLAIKTEPATNAEEISGEVRKDISRAIHSVVDDRGIIGLNDGLDFDIILLGDAARSASQIVGNIELALDNLAKEHCNQFDEIHFSVRRTA